MSPGDPRGRLLASVLLALAALVPACARAQAPGPSPDPSHAPAWAPPGPQTMERRFPQPVQVGALVGRALIEPAVVQTVLGRVTGLVARADGTRALVVRLDGRFGLGWLGLSWLDWSGLDPRLVSVPVEAVALLGEHAVLMDIKPEQLRASPTFTPGSAAAVPAAETIRMGIVKPFH